MSLHPLPCVFPSILWILLLWSCIPKRDIYFHYLWGNSTNLVAPLEKLPFMLVFYPFNGVQELGWFLIYILSEMFNQESNGWIHKLWLFLFQSFNQAPTKDKRWVLILLWWWYIEREASIFGGFWFLCHDIMARYILPLFFLFFLFFLEGGVRGVSAFKLLILKPIWLRLKALFNFGFSFLCFRVCLGILVFLTTSNTCLTPHQHRHEKNKQWKLVTDTCQFSNYCVGGLVR